MTANEQILELVKTLPRGGGYTWDPAKPTSGCPQDIIFNGVTILKKDTATYCCGLTFTVWFRVIGETLTIPPSEMFKVQRFWYCASGNRKGSLDALIAVKMGTPVTINEALPGDFLQLWRKSGSGHSVIYLRHDSAAGTLTYFSTQPATNGPGERTERLANMTELYFVRPLLPL